MLLYYNVHKVVITKELTDIIKSKCNLKHFLQLLSVHAYALLHVEKCVTHRFNSHITCCLGLDFCS